MIKSFKCDRCGKEYSPYDKRAASSLFDLLELSCIFETGKATQDLCYDCYRELQEWFNND